MSRVFQSSKLFKASSIRFTTTTLTTQHLSNSISQPKIGFLQTVFHDHAKDYYIDIQVPGCSKDDLKIEVNKIHLTVTAKLDTCKLISLSDLSLDYQKNVPNLGLLTNHKIEVTKKLLLPANADVTLLKTKLSVSEGLISFIIPKSEELGSLPDKAIDIDDEDVMTLRMGS